MSVTRSIVATDNVLTRLTSVRMTALTLLMISAGSSLAEDATPERTVRIRSGDLLAVFRDNSNSPGELSGIDSLFHVQSAPGYDAFDPDTPGASAGLNFEHIISGHRSPNNKFTPRHGTYRLFPQPDGASVKLVRRAEDSPWKVDSELTYTMNPPHYIDFEFRCIPRDATLFAPQGYAIFFFANYMNDVSSVALNFRGRDATGGPEKWVSATAPRGHVDWNGGGNYRAVPAADLPYDSDVEFRLNTWTYEWPRISQPFYYGVAESGMAMTLMFDRLHSGRDQMRFSLYKFKLPKHPRPAWDFQYVINRVRSNEEYGFQGRLVWKGFVSKADCQNEYKTWAKSNKQDRIHRLKDLGARVFVTDGAVVEVNANRTGIEDRHLDWVSGFVEMTDLSLEGTKVTDVGLSCLSNLQRLEWLNLYQCPIGDDGLSELKHLRQLQHLPVGDSRVTDAGLQHLAEMNSLDYLGLRATAVTDNGIKWLKGLTGLTGLHLGGTKVTDGCLVHLKDMRKLKQLWLDDTLITDAAVEHLAAHRALAELHVTGTRLTEHGIQRLRRALPKCEIEF